MALTLQELTTSLVTGLLEKRYQFSALYRRKGNRSAYPKHLTFKSLADKYGISTRTLNRWLVGETKSTKNVTAYNKIKTDAQKNIKKSRARLKLAGTRVAKQSKKINTHVEKLKFKHGRPTWRVHTSGWGLDNLTDFVHSLIEEKSAAYDFMFTIWSPKSDSGDVKGGPGYISSGWKTTRGEWTETILKKWILREYLARGEIHAIIFTSNK